MFILCEIGLVLALLIGGLIGLTLTKDRYDQDAMRQRQYEAEVAEYQELHAALALYRRFKSGKSPDHKVSAPWADDANGGLSGPAGGRRSSPHHR